MRLQLSTACDHPVACGLLTITLSERRERRRHATYQMQRPTQWKYFTHGGTGSEEDEVASLLGGWAERKRRELS